VCRKRRLNGGGPSDETGKTEVSYHSRRGKIKIPPFSKALSAKQRPKFCSLSPVMVTSPHQWNILERDVKLKIINQSLLEPVGDIGLIDYLLFYVPLMTFTYIWKRQHCQWRAVKFSLWSALRAFEQEGIFIVTRDLGFSSLIWRTAPFSCLLRHTRGYGGSTLTYILKGSSYDTQADAEDLILPVSTRDYNQGNQTVRLFQEKVRPQYMMKNEKLWQLRNEN
jgi:hypothetical protein